MAKKKGGQETKVMADERIMARVRDFFSAHARKLIFLFVAFLALVIGLAVNDYMERAKERRVANYLEENYYPIVARASRPRPMVNQEQDEEELNIEEVLAKVKGTKLRPSVLFGIAKYLFTRGELARAEEIARTLQADYPDIRRYQNLAATLLTKIEEEREFEIAAAGMGPPVPEDLKSSSGESSGGKAGSSSESVSEEGEGGPEKETAGESPPSGESAAGTRQASSSGGESGSGKGAAGATEGSSAGTEEGSGSTAGGGNKTSSRIAFPEGLLKLS